MSGFGGLRPGDRVDKSIVAESMILTSFSVVTAALSRPDAPEEEARNGPLCVALVIPRADKPEQPFSVIVPGREVLADLLIALLNAGEALWPGCSNVPRGPRPCGSAVDGIRVQAVPQPRRDHGTPRRPRRR
jgi:hypothetical protein